MTMTTTLNELCLMVRKPSLEIIRYLKEADYNEPVLRYVLCKFTNNLLIWNFGFFYTYNLLTCLKMEKLEQENQYP